MVMKQEQAVAVGGKPKKARKPRKRFYRGQHPLPEVNLAGELWLAGGWVKLCDITSEEIEWVLYERGSMHSHDWLDIRVVAKYGAADKASYWMSWSLREKRFARGKDAAVMAEHRPSLRDAVAAYLKGPVAAGDPS